MRVRGLGMRVLTVCGLWASTLGATEVSAQARLRLDSAAMLIGSPNRLVVKGPSGMTAVDFGPLDTLSALVVTGDPTDSVFGDERQIALPFSVYDSVGLRIPGLSVSIDGATVRTNDVALLVDFPPPDSTVYSYRGIRREGARLSDFAGWIAIFVTLLLAGLGAYYYYRRQRERGVAVPPPRVVPAHETAFAQLDALAASELPDKPYYSQLDRIIRTYLEGRYHLPALERTTGEVLTLLRERRLPSEGLESLLDEVDLVKFAKAELPQRRRAESLARVREFVERTRGSDLDALTALPSQHPEPPSP